jgi:hypothetical protein
MFLIALSALPFATALPGPAAVLSDVRAAMVSPAVRSGATATASAMTRTPSPTASVARQPSPAPMTATAVVTSTQTAVGGTGSPIPPASPTAPVAGVEDGGTGASIAQSTPTARATVGVTGATATPIPSAAPTATETVAPAVAVAPPPTALNGVEQIIATRGDNGLAHDITLVDPLPSNSWGRHGTEDNKSLPPGNNTVAPWLVVERDASQINANLDVRFNIRNIRCYSYQPSTHSWIKIYSGLPGWMVSSDPSTASGYVPITPTIESDGSYSFDVPAGRALHMSSGQWWPTLAQSDGILTTLEARLIGPGVAAAKIAVAPGADFRTNADYTTTNQSGFGHLGLLTQDWQTYHMLSSVLTDNEVRANPPPPQ